MTNITIPSGVTTIGDEAFWGCSSLTSITIPSSIITIGKNAFYICYNLKTINIMKPEGSISGYENKWGATDATINWNYQ